MPLFNLKALLSQWKPREAAVNLDTCQNLQRHRAVLLAIARHHVKVMHVFMSSSLRLHKYTSRKRSRNSRMVTWPMTSRDVWHHSGDKCTWILLPHYLVKVICSAVQRFIHTCMMYSILAGLICTTSSVNPDNSRYFSSKRFKGVTT